MTRLTDDDLARLDRYCDAGLLHSDEMRLLLAELRAHRSTALSAEEVEALRLENHALRDSLIHACELQRASHDNARQISAMRYVANVRSMPFTHARVQERYDLYKADETTAPRPPSTAEADYLRKLHDFMKGYAEECSDVPTWVPGALVCLTRLTAGKP